jgi:electron transfer flavoprotein beta subunit
MAERSEVMPGARAPAIVACLKLVDHRPEVDALSGEVRTDPRTSGASDADAAALEWALRLGGAWGREVVAVTAGPAAADAVLREALAAGATRAVRVDLEADAPSEAVAVALAPVVTGAAVVVCGNWSLDRGSGSVPAYLAAHRHAAQALGLVTLAFAAEHPDEVTAVRRLDGGRRERLVATAPVVLSVEGASARLRRAGLAGLLAARHAAIEQVAAEPSAVVAATTGVRTGPYRPRGRVLAPPPAGLDARQRVLSLTGALVERTPPQHVVADAPEAADRLLAQLRAWGYLP